MTEREIFAAALEKNDLALRADFLEHTCGDDVALRRRVESLIKAHEGGRVFLEPPTTPREADATSSDSDKTAADSTRSLAQALRPTSEGPGSCIGPYKLLQEIGHGGMGAVFIAEQEQPIRRRVALKIIKPGMDSDQVIARFEAERQALALMDHQNIARVLDAGTTLTGRPFFVMDLVSGIPITEYCDRYRLTPRERLELFVPVCRAIQHAHQKGVIHRDIKPSNVLVSIYDGKPLPKVIDFGVAKAIDQRLTERTLFTQLGAVIGTPEYMSPEQAGIRGLDVDTRSDIYSLGVLLYELLTGSTPLRRETLRQASFDEILRRVRDEEPPRPSTRLSQSTENLPSISAQRHVGPAQLRKLVRGELDWIVMKALEKDRTRRYETASAFAADVVRYLKDQPIEARPPSPWYRFRKFARRNRVSLTTGALVALALVVGTVISTSQAVRATRAEKRALAALAMAEANFRDAWAAVDDYLTRVSQEKLRDVSGMQPLRKDLLERALGYYRKFIQQHPDDPRLRSELADAHERVGMIIDMIGSRTEALQAHQAALTLRQALSREAPTIPEYRQAEAKSHDNIGNLLRVTDHNNEAEQAHRRAIEILENLVRDHPKIVAFRQDLARSFNNLGALQVAARREAEAERSYQRSIEILEPLTLADHPDHDEFQQALAEGYVDLGNRKGLTGHAQQAMKWYQKAILIFEQLARNRPNVTAFWQDLGKTHDNVGALHSLIGQRAEAVRSYQQALTIQEKLATEHPAVVEFQQDLAKTYNDLGIAQAATGLAKEALLSHQRAIRILDRLTGDHPEAVAFQQERARGYASLSEAQRVIGRPSDAMQTLQRAINIQERLAEEHAGVDEFQRDLCASYMTLGRLLRLKSADGSAEPLVAWRKAERQLESLSKPLPSDDYNLACVRSQIYGLLRSSSSQPGRDGDVRLEPEQAAVKALETLRRAIAAGFSDVDQIKKDEDLDPVRSRADFQEIVRKLGREEVRPT